LQRTKNGAEGKLKANKWNVSERKCQVTAREKIGQNLQGHWGGGGQKKKRLGGKVI